MPDANDNIRKKLRQAREEAHLSQRELAERVGCAQVTISNIEKGRIRVNAADLVEFSRVLCKPIQFFYQDQDCSSAPSGDELSLLLLFREFDKTWQRNLLENMQMQLAFYRGLRQVEVMPPGEERARATDELCAKEWEMEGLKVVRDEQARPGIDASALEMGIMISRLQASGVAETLARIRATPEEQRAEKAYDLLYVLLETEGPRLTVDEQDIAHINAGELRAFLKTQSDEVRPLIDELLNIAKVTLD